MLNIIYALIILFLGFLLANKVASSLRKQDRAPLNYLWLYHVLFALFYTQFLKGDANYYYETALQMDASQFRTYLSQGLGTHFIFGFNYIFAHLLKMNYIITTLSYALMGYVGIVCFYIVTVKCIPQNSKLGRLNLFPFLFFLPNLHIWSCAVGKDSLSFMCIGLFAYGMLAWRKRMFLLLFALFFAYCIRPHITFFLIASFGFVLTFSESLTKKQRIVIVMFLVIGGLLLLPKVMSYAQIEDTSLASFQNFSNSRISNLSRSHTGSRIDISNYPLPLKMVTFLYRPLFFDITSIPGLLASIENALLLFLSIRVLKQKPKWVYKNAPVIVQGLLVFLFLGTLAFSNMLSNLGIMLRMRNMFLPCLILYVLWSNSYYNQHSQKEQP